MASATDIPRAPLRDALAHVERLPLGDAVIVHNRESGAMVATNAFGALLIDRLREVPDAGAVVGQVAAALGQPEDAVRGAVDDTLTRWEADGLFLTALRPFPLAVPHRPAAGAVTRSLALGPRAVSLACEDAGLVDDLDRALAPMRLAQARAAPAPVHLDILHDGAGYGVFRDGDPIWGVAGYEPHPLPRAARDHGRALRPGTGGRRNHASAMAMDGRALVFAGPSGSGKSTLATLLLGAGAALAADDHVALTTGGDAVLAFPTRPNLKPGTAELPAVAAVIAAEREGQGPFVPKARVPVGTELRLSGFVFPRYAADADNALIPLAPEAALRELIQTGSRVSRSTKSIAPLLHALDTHRAGGSPTATPTSPSGPAAGSSRTDSVSKSATNPCHSLAFPPFYWCPNLPIQPWQRMPPRAHATGRTEAQHQVES
ncbi:MAG: hypothetical protein R3D80_02500 [Paracoccaceae bacterium]